MLLFSTHFVNIQTHRGTINIEAQSLTLLIQNLCACVEYRKRLPRAGRQTNTESVVALNKIYRLPETAHDLTFFFTIFFGFFQSVKHVYVNGR